MRQGERLDEMADATILVVDDEPGVCNMLCRFLEPAGYRTKKAYSSGLAKSELEKEHFDLVVSDLYMPGESGLELVRFVKEHYPETGCMICTSESDLDTAREILEIGVYGYVIKPFTRSTLLVSVSNALHHLHLAREMRESKRSLEAEVRNQSEWLKIIMDNLNAGVVLFDPDMKVLEMNNQFHQWFPDGESIRRSYCNHLDVDTDAGHRCEDCLVLDAFRGQKAMELSKHLRIDEQALDFRLIFSPIQDQEGEIVAIVGLYIDITEKNILEQELRQAQKIEAIGQLAAGITHEINTPVQYVGDNLNFLKEACKDVMDLVVRSRGLCTAALAGSGLDIDEVRQLAAAMEEADVDYLIEEIPLTVHQGIEGIRRVEKIVRAMKEFSHPGSDVKNEANINELLDSTLTVSRNQWKYVAELETDYQADLPPVPCFAGEINQVFLNLIVNAAHAMEERNRDGKGALGKLTVTTRRKDGSVEVRIGDTGGGIPSHIQDRIFDPFFTTKEVGKGTGQGLAIARRAVVEKHQGSLRFETVPGHGTTFIIELPLGTGEPA